VFFCVNIVVVLAIVTLFTFENVKFLVKTSPYLISTCVTESK
jgi:hypothetical protein